MVFDGIALARVLMFVLFQKQEELLAELKNKVTIEVELKQQLQKSQLQLQHQHEQHSQDVSVLQQEFQRKVVHVHSYVCM